VDGAGSLGGGGGGRVLVVVGSAKVGLADEVDGLEATGVGTGDEPDGGDGCGVLREQAARRRPPAPTRPTSSSNW
jgi:hypothetical protein